MSTSEREGGYKFRTEEAVKLSHPIEKRYCGAIVFFKPINHRELDEKMKKNVKLL